MITLNLETTKDLIGKYMELIRTLDPEYKHQSDEEIMLRAMQQLHADVLYDAQLQME